MRDVGLSTDLGEENDYGVVFSGGGALGAWEVGCLRILSKRHGNLPRFLAGASAGALNAAAIASGFSLDELENVWRDIKPEDVYKKSPTDRTWLSIFFDVAIASYRKRSFWDGVKESASQIEAIFDSRPLEITLRKLLRERWEDFQRFKGRFVIATTDLAKKHCQYFYTANDTKFYDKDNFTEITNLELFINALRASTAIPIIFPPIGTLVDGGVSRNQPLGAAIQTFKEGIPIYVVMPNFEDLPTRLNLESLPTRIMEMWLGSGLQNELALARIKNTAREGLGKSPIQIKIIRASVDLNSLGSGLLEFGSCVDSLLDQGENDAEVALMKT